MAEEKQTDVMQITRDMTIEEILTTFPQKSQKLAQEMTRAGLHCVGCQAAVWETLEAGVLGHGFTVDELENLLQRLNKILEEKIDPNTITVTERAAEKYRAILQDEGKAGYGLRFGDMAGGCSGFEYILDYSEAATEEDEVFVSQGVEIHINRNMLPRLLGCEIDYIDGLNGSGFKISNPNARGSCGCGKSQSY
ncbi:MAG: iron-sulfur cluster assembly accessory protein [Rhabdochlamydiaceae bacterium]|nr:iron-sulfur cluster assembly accessory protein [Rhabdochlamydiaceae bacterium]